MASALQTDGQQVCARSIEAGVGYDPALWVANVQSRNGHPGAAPVEEVRWIPLPDDPGQTLGYIECVAMPWHSGFPEPTLRSRFAVYRPTGSAQASSPWQAPTTGANWRLCSGATMDRFDVDSCAFTPAAEAPALLQRR